MATNVAKSILHNLGVVLVGFAFALLGRACDSIFRLAHFHFLPAVIAGWLLVAIGFLIRVWATYLFYERHMKVISLETQTHFVTQGPYHFSRNPLYLGGNLFIFLGAVLILGSSGGMILTAVNLIAVEFMIRHEEKQLAQKFGNEWREYSRKVRRWF